MTTSHSSYKKIFKNSCYANLSLAGHIGVEEAFFFNKLQYWILKCGRYLDDKKSLWIYNSLTSWHKQFPSFSMYKLRKIIKKLEDIGLVKSIKVNAKKWNHTKWYAVNLKIYNNLTITHPDRLQKCFKVFASKDQINKNFVATNEPILLKEKSTIRIVFVTMYAFLTPPFNIPLKASL